MAAFSCPSAFGGARKSYRNDFHLLVEARLRPLQEVALARGVRLVEKWKGLQGQRLSLSQHSPPVKRGRIFPHFLSPVNSYIERVLASVSLGSNVKRERTYHPSHHRAPWETKTTHLVTVNPTCLRQYEDDPDEAVVKARKKEIVVETLNALPPHDLSVWTDGASNLNQGQSGSAAIIFNARGDKIKEVRGSAGPLACSYRAECVAMVMALKTLHTMPIK